MVGIIYNWHEKLNPTKHRSWKRSTKIVTSRVQRKRACVPCCVLDASSPRANHEALESAVPSAPETGTVPEEIQEGGYRKDVTADVLEVKEPVAKKQKLHREVRSLVRTMEESNVLAAVTKTLQETNFTSLNALVSWQSLLGSWRAVARQPTLRNVLL